MADRKNKYIPHLAEYYFIPEPDWEKSKAEEMYLAKKHKIQDEIIYGDCIKGMDELEDGSVDLVVADPPFGIDFSGKESIYNRKSENVVEGYIEVDGGYDKFTLDWISKLPRILKDTASVYIFSGYTNLKDVLIAIEKAGLYLINHIIWKYQFGVFTRKKFVTSHYHLLFAVKNPKKYFFHRIRHYNLDVWDYSRTYAANQKKNGTKLPEEVVADCIDFNSKPGDLVLDPFMGNGTTALVAKKNYRHYIGFELNKKMREIIEANIESASLGESYRKYSDRLPTAEELRKIDPDYERAYQIYIKGTKARI